MTTLALGALGYAWLLGALTVVLLWPRSRSVRSDLPLILPLGFGIGFGITSVIFFISSLLTANALPLAMVMELVLGGGLALALWRRHPLPAAGAPVRPERNGWITAILVSALAQAGVIAAVVSRRAFLAEPHGSWDGWAIWNMHARFIFRGHENWPRLLSAPQLVWTHPDYPLLIPAGVARAWVYAGQEAPFLGGLISAAFAVATAGLLFAAIARLRRRSIACVAGLLLLGTPFFLTFSSNQHADIPLGFFFLAAVAMMALGQNLPESRGLAALAGLCAGLAAWTKNEGLLFALIAGLAWGCDGMARERRRSTAAFLVALLVALLPVLFSKLALAPRNDLVSGVLAGNPGHVLDWARHRLILSSLGRDLLRFGEWSVVPFLAMMLPLIGSGWRRLNRAEWRVAVVVVLMGAGYYTVYLLTPLDLAWHLDSSLVRLLLQLWPAALFFWCLAVTPEGPGEAPATGAGVVGRRAALALLAAVNVAVAFGLGVAFARQLAPNELARASGGEVSLILGEGWFSPERDDRTRWIWSQGSSTLLFQSSASEPTTVGLRFRIRGLGTRNVTATIGDRVVWRAHVGEPLADAAIVELTLPPGITVMAFDTDTLGVPESANPGARNLTFAVYDPEMK